MNHNIEIFLEEDEIRNDTFRHILQELYSEKRKTFSDFIRNPIPIKKLKKLEILFTQCVLTITRTPEKTILKQIPKFIYDKRNKKEEKKEIKPVIVKLIDTEYDLNKITCQESLDIIWNLLNKGALAGSFNILDGFIAKQLYCKILLKLNIPIKPSNISL